MFSTMQGIVIGIVIVVAIIVMVIIATENTRRTRDRLRRRFGPEYDRSVVEFGSVAKAERELLKRSRRFDRFKLRPLNDADRMHYSASWTAAQTKFVDDPSGAVSDANDLIKVVMMARGYPVEDFEHRVADLSVEHANVVQHYRAARTLALANREGRANTEELRQAFVHYRALYNDLWPAPGTDHPPWLRPARA
ncbi:MAG: hypothetical protein ABW133_13020 [Polyangiaceae bacterium]